MKKVLFISPFIIIFFFLASCRQSRVVVHERPVPLHYVQPLAPGPNYIWHSGEWIKYRHTYVYHKGFWMKAPGSPEVILKDIGQEEEQTGSGFQDIGNNIFKIK